VIILDEPTSALESASADNLVRILSVLRERQVAVLFVSHILEEVIALCDRVTVLRDGHPVLSGVEMSALDVDAIVRAMLGDELVEEEEQPARTGPMRLRVADRLGAAIEESDTDLVMRGVSLSRRLHGFDLRVRGGEIVGLAGVAGAGHLAALELLSGVRQPSAGQIRLPGIGRGPRNQRDAIRSGVALVTGDRRRLGLMLEKSLWENIAQVRAVGMAADGPLLRAAEMRERAVVLAQRLEIKASSVDMAAGQLSGGNQQKVVFAKWLDAAPSVLLLDDPSRGVDVGAKAEMHALIRAAADAGAIIVLCSTDVEELASVCERVVVLRHGAYGEELAGEHLEPHRLLAAMNAA
jgi:ABC-type sugar transport system ATPase subunit